MAKRKLGALRTEELEAELQKRQGRTQDLEKRREELVSEIEAVDQELAQLGVTTEGQPTRRRGASRKRRTQRRGPGRPRGSRTRRSGRNPGRLNEVIAGVLSDGKPRRVPDIVQEVLQQGYTTQSKNFSNIVSQALSNDPRFKKVGRGQYGLAKESSAAAE